MSQKNIRYATYLVLFTAAISGVSNFLNKIAVTTVKDPIFYTTLKNVLVAMLLLGLILVFKKWAEIKSLSRKQIYKLLAIGLVGGSLPFALFFTGLAQTSALNAGLIHKTLFIWVALLAIPLLKEKIFWWQAVGMAAIFCANILVGGFSGFRYNLGELMIVGATILWAIENVIAKVALREISSLTVAGARMIFGSIVLLAVVLVQGHIGLVTRLDGQNWGWTILTSALLLGYVLTWYTALKYAPATYVATLLVPATLITNILSAIFVTHTTTLQQIFSSILFVLGAALVVIFGRRVAGQAQAEAVKQLA